MRINLDLCAIQRPFDDPSQARVRNEAEALYRILDLVRQGMLELVGSFVLEMESGASRDAVRRAYTESVLELAYERVEPGEAVEERTELYRVLGLKTSDAAHLAAAVEAGADLFCTCDDRFLRRARVADTGLTRAVSLLELIEEVK